MANDQNDLHTISLDLMRSRKLEVSDEESRFFAALRHKELENEMAQAIFALYSAKLLESALQDHARALTKSAEASEQHASSLKWATWALVAVTAALVFVTVYGR